jgi:hypothetical protein
MLRYIVSVSLAMAACSTLIPTKASAATLTVTPVGEIPKRPGDSIEFIVELNPGPSTVVKLLGYGFIPDNSELSFPTENLTGFRPLIPITTGTPINTTTILASGSFNVLTPVKDGSSDFKASVLYEEYSSSGTPTQFTVFASGGDVVPVPEPVTIFGTFTALGCGTLFKRKSFKKKKS